MGNLIWCVEFKFEPRDIWIGLFWDKRPLLHLYFIIIPMLVLHIYRKRK
jgi:hypothetical protein